MLMTNDSSERVRPNTAISTPPVLIEESIPSCIEIPKPGDLNTAVGEVINTRERNSTFSHMDV